MANSLGYYILSPATFSVEWDGNVSGDANIKILERATHGDVDNHAAYGSFTVQPGFLPVTDNPGEFLFIKGIPNERGLPYSCMEAIIEAWWNPATFGLVFLLNQPGKFVTKIGQPIAQMFAISPAPCCLSELQVFDGVPDEYRTWEHRRRRDDYVKDFDYMRGLHADGREEHTHTTSWDEYGLKCNRRSPVGEILHR